MKQNAAVIQIFPTMIQRTEKVENVSRVWGDQATSFNKSKSTMDAVHTDLSWLNPFSLADGPNTIRNIIQIQSTNTPYIKYKIQYHNSWRPHINPFTLGNGPHAVQYR